MPLLIDGDIFLYRCGFAVEKTKYLVTFEDGKAEDYFDTAKEAKALAKDSGIIWSRKEVEPVEHALQVCKNSLKGVYDKFWPKGDKCERRIFLTGRGNFRESLEYDRGYKDNRDPTHRPKHYRALKEYLISKHGAKVVNGIEADDAIGVEAYSRGIDKYVIVSNDKDLDQISGYHYDWTTGSLYFVNDEDALKMFYYQLLYGDPTDNVKGPVSEKKARETVDECRSPKELAEVSKELYTKAYGDLWGEKIDVIGELVWIRRTEQPTGDRGLWNPFWEHLHGA